MSNLAWNWRATGFAAIAATILAGCAWIPVAPGQSGGARDQPGSPRPSPRPEFDPRTACAEVVKAHNRARADAKLPSLAVSPKLQAAALEHARDMAQHGKITHEGSDGSKATDRITAQGYQYRRAGENIAAGLFSIGELMKGWMNSPPHKRNILGSFSQIGVAYATAENGKRYWCVNFGLPTRR
jgi:uncharacterized protein YkwD